MMNDSINSASAWKRALGWTAILGALAAPIAVGTANSVRLRAQTPQPGTPAPAFEVASIKPNNSGDGRVMLGNQPGRFTATNVTLRMLIRQAYQLQDFQISG